MDYNTALCDFLKLPADPCIQSFTDVTTQIYPLRADPEKIKAFCDQYLNRDKSPYETFEPAGPWIIMQVCDYGEISFKKPDVGQFAHRWFSQHELAFGIPVRCREKPSGDFREFGVVYPFIFVDSPLAMEGGRQIYGWPKAGINIETTPPEFQPNLPRTLVRVKVSPFLADKSGQNSPDVPFVEIHQARPFLSGRSGIAEAVTSLPRAVSGYLSVASSVLESMSNLANLLAGYKLPTTGSISDNLATMGRDVQSLIDTMQKGFGYFNSMIPMLIGAATGSQGSATTAAPPKVTIYTMKQVRDAANTSSACYQAIVRSEMTVDQVKDGGLLFDPLSGDPSGGIEIKLRSKGNEYMAALADMVSPGSITNEGGGLLCVRPLVPFWEKVDLSYGLADRQSWRTKQTEWQQESIASSSKKDAAKKKQVIRYEKRGSGSALAVSGKRVASNAVLHIFVLEANPKRLRDLINDYLNKLAEPNQKNNQPSFEFEVKDYPFVYVTLLSYDKMTIDGNGQYGDSVLAFAVLVKYWKLDEKNVRNGDPTHAFIPIYTFVGTDWNFVTEYEVYGRLTFRSTLDSPEDTWVKQSAPSDKHREVLSVSTTLFPDAKSENGSVSGGKGAAPVKVIAISSQPFKLAEPETCSFSTASPQDPGWLSLESYGLEEYLTTPSNLASNNVRTPDSIALKQVRSAIHGHLADYQSLVAVQRAFKLADKFGKSTVRIRIYENEGLPIVKNLGLVGNVTPGSGEDWSSNEGDVPFKQFDAKAMSFTGTLEEGQGRELWWRVGGQEVWTSVI